MEIATIGVDLAKHVFQVHGVAPDGSVVVRQRLRLQVIGFFAKPPPCLVGMEACGTGRHWARELTAVEHQVAAAAGALREGLCEAWQERRRRRRGDLRGSGQAEHALGNSYIRRLLIVGAPSALLSSKGSPRGLLKIARQGRINGRAGASAASAARWRLPCSARRRPRACGARPPRIG